MNEAIAKEALIAGYAFRLAFKQTWSVKDAADFCGNFARELAALATPPDTARGVVKHKALDELFERFCSKMEPPLTAREKQVAAIAMGFAVGTPAEPAQGEIEALTEELAGAGAREEALRAEIDELRAEAVQARGGGVTDARKLFPILGSGGAKIDYQLVADHGGQAKKNHYQSVDRLAERGGLSWCELYAVLHNKPWAKMDNNEAMLSCRALEARYLAALTRSEPTDSARPVSDEDVEAAKLFDVLREESWDLRCFDMPTGGGDADIGWRVVGHWMAKPHERVIAEVYTDDPRKAVLEAVETRRAGQ